MIITFKSNENFYWDELHGNKCNTVRKTDNKDERFQWLEQDMAKEIQIINAQNPEESFIRKISHVCEYEGMTIISWTHKNEEKHGERQ